MIITCEEVLTLSELKVALDLSNDELNLLIEHGLPFVKVKDRKLFVMESVLVFLKRIQEGGKP
jgi:hypothetical protein